MYSLGQNQSKSGDASGQGSGCIIWSHARKPKPSLKWLPSSALTLLAEIKCCAFEWFLEDHLRFPKSVPVSPFPSHNTYIISMANWLFWGRVWFPACQIFVAWDVDIRLQAEHFQLKDKVHEGKQGEFSTPVLHPSTKNTVFKDWRQIHRRLPEVKGNAWSHCSILFAAKILQGWRKADTRKGYTAIPGKRSRSSEHRPCTFSALLAKLHTFNSSPCLKKIYDAW